MPDGGAGNALREQLRAGGWYQEGAHFRLISGYHSDSYLHLRVALTDVATREQVADVASAALREKDWAPTAFAAVTVGGLLLAEALCSRWEVPWIIGRTTATRVRFPSLPPPGSTETERVVLVDDVFTTGKELSAARRELDRRGVDVLGAVVAVDFRGAAHTTDSLMGDLPMCCGVSFERELYDPGTCPQCAAGMVPIDLANAEVDFVAALMSVPESLWDNTIAAYHRAYDLQESPLLSPLERMRGCIFGLRDTLPRHQIRQIGGLDWFVRSIAQASEDLDLDTNVVAALVGALVAMTNRRVENRRLGCSLLIGDPQALRGYLPTPAPVAPPAGVNVDQLELLTPYLDAVSEEDAAFIIGGSGQVEDVRRLRYDSPDDVHFAGLTALRELTKQRAIGVSVRRQRSAIAVYSQGELLCVAELSERTGLWQFSAPFTDLDSIGELLAADPAQVTRTLERILEVSQEMVTHGYGGLFVLAPSVGEFPRHGAPKIAMQRQPFDRLNNRQVANIAKLDGAVLVTHDGLLVQATVILDVEMNDGRPADAPPHHGSIGGSRRAAARAASEAGDGIGAVCVSQNGTVDVYVAGQAFPVMDSMLAG